MLRGVEHNPAGNAHLDFSGFPSIDDVHLARIQTIRIEVQDVDEPPAFVNGPVPFLTVVPLETPVGFHVYKFVARDEAGDGDEDVEYRLINTEPSGMFTVDPATGVVRTAVRQYKEGQMYRVLVQAIDKSPGDNSTKQESEVAKLEILAGDRPPQFLQQHYSVSLAEDSLVDYSVVDVRAHRFRAIDDGRSKGELTYSLYGYHGGQREETSVFGIDPKSGVIHLRRLLDYDDPSQPKLYKLIVLASEDGKESSVPVDVQISDVNDNAPIFSRPLYTTQVREDFPIGSTILKVHTEDKDSGDNARVRYSVDNDNFTINDKGELSAKNRLDADQFKERFFIYRFNVTATDFGNPPLSSNATVLPLSLPLNLKVHIRTENTNDEAPVFFPTRHYTAYIAEDAQGGTPVVQIQARDPDRDQVEYAFVDKDGKETYETTLFHIDKDTGLIKLRAGVHATDLLRNDSPYNLTVIARDDGSCCSTESAQHTALATVLIGIEDVNNNKPEFHACASYGEMAKIQEGVYKKDPPVIIKVEATDEDSSSNGQIVYSLYYAQSESRKPFVIDKLTGVLTPSPHVIFDRETRPREDVTVKATDRGDRPLIGFCQFSIEVVDVNDNAPQFDRASYETSISRSETVGTSILTVFAFDNDAPHNANVTYHLEADPSAGEEFQDDASFFRILNEHSGEITLMKPIPKNQKKDKFVFNVVADDNGIPETQRTTVQVTIKIHEKQQAAPRWQTSPDCKKEVTVVENTEMNKVLLRCRAVAGDGSKSSIVYKLTNGAVSRPGKPDSKFRQFNKIEDGREWVEVVIMEPLDYEQAHNYTLTLTATDVNSHVSSSRSFVVLVEDVNDVVPQFTVDLFTGTVDEELTPAEYLEKFDRKPITTVKAVDSDSNGPQNEVHYRILDVPDDSGAHLFRIDELTGEIWPNAKFDREQKDMYILTVEARDNLPSALPGATGPNKDNVKVQIVIGDVNDNAPSFDEPKYIGKVLENADPGHDIITIKAHDMDKHSTLRYDVVAAQGGRIPFGARTDSGAIFVKEPLDYEQESVYQLRLLVSDGRHNASTDVFIYVEDVNDNAPVFEQPSYSTTILEEDPDIPKVLFHVRATDADKDEKSRRIVYLLEGQGAGEFFRIGRETGDIELVKALDRDPPNGVPTWNFIVQAIDDDGRGLIGYADVQVNLKDINDNAPIFADDLYGYVEENREPHSRDGVYFMDVRATDYDDPTTDNAKLEYSIVLNKEIDGVPVFRIDPASGKIFAMRRSKTEGLERALDRELPSEREFVIEVRATDRGTPPREGAANVTIKVLDKNDNTPSFERAQYDAVVAETAPVGAAVISVSATDPDDEAIDNLFTYTLADDSKYFYMTTDRDSSDSYVGVLRVKRVMDKLPSDQACGSRVPLFPCMLPKVHLFIPSNLLKALQK
ncbi:cadherin domain protein [Ancylostoma ceylanicum]|uniref:Cadherin domain protein n=1 Tax=Ancylostoma ceylanicum TaxID=53326 RepID=A0A0D6LS41_9BILA|nr:cadherin domain protein [Ancylostoma ceylanicum]